MNKLKVGPIGFCNALLSTVAVKLRKLSKRKFKVEDYYKSHLSRITLVATENERKLVDFQALELLLIKCTSLTELFNVISPDTGVTNEHCNKIMNWNIIRVILIDPEYEIQRTLEEGGLSEHTKSLIVFVNDKDEIQKYKDPTTRLLPDLSQGYLCQREYMFTYLDQYSHDNHKHFFPNLVRARPSSVAIIPLTSSGVFIGSLCIGSPEITRFVRGVRTDFFDFFSSVLSLCLENAMNIERLKREGMTDGLTQINNRRKFDTSIEKEIENAFKSRTPLTCMLLDIDHFKSVNDTKGHVFGDEVIKSIAMITENIVNNQGSVYRYGGEEFSVLVRLNCAEASIVAEEIRSAIENNKLDTPDGNNLQVTVSIGVASIIPATNKKSESITTPSSITKCADDYLYQAKESGRNKVCSSGDITMDDFNKKNKSCET